MPGFTPLAHRRECPMFKEPESREIRQVQPGQCLNCGGFYGAHFDDCPDHPLAQIVTPPSEPHIGAGNVVSFNERRADHEENNALWTPVECLQAAIRDIESGAVKAKRVMVLIVSDPDDALETYLQNVNTLDRVIITAGAHWRALQKQWP